jgi:hypothetical protein
MPGHLRSFETLHPDLLKNHSVNGVTGTRFSRLPLVPWTKIYYVCPYYPARGWFVLYDSSGAKWFSFVRVYAHWLYEERCD